MAELLVALPGLRPEDYLRLTVGQRAAIIAEHNRVHRQRRPRKK